MEFLELHSAISSQKDDYDPSKHAAVSFSTLKWIIRKWIADVYHQETHRALQTTPAQDVGNQQSGPRISAFQMSQRRSMPSWAACTVVF